MLINVWSRIVSALKKKEKKTKNIEKNLSENVVELIISEARWQVNNCRSFWWTHVEYRHQWNALLCCVVRMFLSLSCCDNNTECLFALLLLMRDFHSQQCFTLAHYLHSSRAIDRDALPSRKERSSTSWLRSIKIPEKSIFVLWQAWFSKDRNNILPLVVSLLSLSLSHSSSAFLIDIFKPFFFIASFLHPLTFIWTRY